MSRTLKITATKPQAAFHALKSKYSLFVGGYGSGKSETLLNQGMMDSLEAPTATIGLYEPTYQLVNDILVGRLMEKLEVYGLMPTLHKSEKRITTEHPQCGSFVLRTLDKPENIIGYECYRTHIDEIDTLPKKKAQEAWIKIQARNRQRPAGIKNPFNRVSVYTTPEGFNFAYDQWITNSTEYHDMVKASSYSNPWLPQDYIDALVATYPEELVKAYINGDFVNLQSGTVYRSFKRGAQESKETVQGSETIYVGMDFNIDHMAATIYVKRQPLGNSEQLNNQAVWHAVDEISEAYDTKAVCGILKGRYPKNTIIVYPDSSGIKRSTATAAGAAESDIAILQQNGFRVKAHASNPRVKDRVMAMNAALEKGLVRINAESCKRTVQCLEQQVYDKNGEPDKSSDVDHQNDASSYPVAYEMPIRKPLANVKVSFKI